MEDLVPFLIFIVIAIVNVLKFVAEKGGKKKTVTSQPGEVPTERTSSSFEEFFEDLAEKIAPKPAELPDWPEGLERPDYLQEMEEFKHEPVQEFKENSVAEPIPMPEPLPVATEESLPFQQMGKPATFAPPVQMAASAGTQSIRMRIPSVPIMRIPSGRNIDFDLKNREKLKQAIIANLIFSPPRAYDTSFENTMAK